MAHRYGLIGKNIDYSFSRTYFAEKFRTTGLADHFYDNYDLEDISAFKKVVTTTEGLKGLNVTIPYKEEVIEFLDELDPVARQIGAVNTIAINKGKLKGYNTDAFGFMSSLKAVLPTQVNKALVLGTGGASKAVLYALKSMGITPSLVSRRPGKDRYSYSDLTPEIMLDHQLIVNCTPLGTFPEISNKPPIPYEALTPDHFLYELIYNPEQTAFLKEGQKRGALGCNGYQMLVQQAEKAWEIWNSNS